MFQRALIAGVGARETVAGARDPPCTPTLVYRSDTRGVIVMASCSTVTNRRL